MVLHSTIRAMYDTLCFTVMIDELQGKIYSYKMNICRGGMEGTIL